MKQLFSVTILSFLALGLLSGCASSKKAAGPHPLAGMWDYTVTGPDAEYRGVVTISEVDGGLVGSISNDALAGQMDVSDLSFEDNTLTFSFDSGQYGIIEFNVDVQDDMFDGTIGVEEFGQMPVKGKKKTEEM